MLPTRLLPQPSVERAFQIRQRDRRSAQLVPGNVVCREDHQRLGDVARGVMVRPLQRHLLVVHHLGGDPHPAPDGASPERSEEHTSELQSRENLVCRLLLEKKKKQRTQLSLIKKKKNNTK